MRTSNPKVTEPDRHGPVFIVGGSRTGSEMLKTMLSTGTDLDFTDELFLLCPRWLHKDLRQNIKEHVGELSDSRAIERLVDLCFSGIPYGWIWSVSERELDRAILTEELSKQPLTLRRIFESLMVTHARMRGKARIGAKFPVHYSYCQKLLEWFPDCRIVHTTRDPRAVYASQAAKHVSLDWPAWRSAFERTRQFFHIYLQTIWTARLHAELYELPNYKLVRYEDVVLDPECTLHELCRFLDLEYRPEMLHPRQYQTSYKELHGVVGIDRRPLTMWTQKLTPGTVLLLERLMARPAQVLGYDLTRA